MGAGVRPGLHRLLSGLLALGLGLLVALAAAEAALRILRPQAVGVSHVPRIYDWDEELGYRYRPGAVGRIERLFEVSNRVVINESGFHDVDRPDRRAPRDPAPVLAVGDSFTAGLHVPVDDTWTRVLERALARDAGPGRPGRPVYNLGLDGTGSDVQLALLRENLARLDPAHVLVAFFVNDIADVRFGRMFREVRGRYVLQPRSADERRAMRRLADRMQERRLSLWAFDHVYLVRFGVFLANGDRNLYRNNLVMPGDLAPDRPPVRGAPAAAPSLREIFAEFQRLGREHGFELTVVPVPGRDAPDASLRELRRRVSLPGLEIADVLPRLEALAAEAGRGHADLYYRWDGHFNELGHACFGEAVARTLGSRLRSPPD